MRVVPPMKTRLGRRTTARRIGRGASCRMVGVTWVTGRLSTIKVAGLIAAIFAIVAVFAGVVGLVGVGRTAAYCWDGMA